MRLKTFFPNGVEFGDGIACALSPFSAFLILDFYDGPTEGFARLSTGRHLIYFTKIWWDDDQNNRLFDAYIVADDDLRALDESLLREIEKGFSVSSSAASNGEKAAVNRIEPRQLLANSPAAVHVVIFCESITGELFVRPLRHSA